MDKDQSKDMLDSILKITFEQNMNCLRSEIPSLYEMFIDYTPESHFLALDESGNLNIKSPDGFVYDQNPKEISEKQYALYTQHPQSARYILDLNLTDEEKEKQLFRHVELCSNIVDLANEIEKEYAGCDVELNDYYPLMVIIGIGIGYHLEYLTDENIGHLFIYESNEDFFYASLFVVNYVSLLKKYTDNNKGITIAIGDDPQRFIDRFCNVISRIGIYKSGILPIYRHYESETSSAALNMLYDNLVRIYSGFGFFEDEVISLEHTLKNCTSESLFVPTDLDLSPYTNTPVFIVANGPSLDSDIEYIKSNREQVLVFSCGSVLSTLYKSGISPDLHFEIERTEGLFDWVTVIKDKDYLSNITVVANNTLAPKVLSVFKNSILFLKPNDAAVALFMSVYSIDYVHKALLLYGCNPSVANAAIAFSAEHGFKNIYLFGTDNGFKDPKYHHSKNSAYYDKFEGVKEFKSIKNVRGNFGGIIHTTEFFDFSRHTAEYVIRRTEDKEIHWNNCADGALISGAKPVHSSEINLDKDVRESISIGSYIRSNSLTNYFEQEKLKNKLRATRYTLSETFKQMFKSEYESKSFSVEELMDIFNYQNNIIHNIGREIDPVTYQLVKGSLTYLQTAIVGRLYRLPNKESRELFINKSLIMMNDYFIVMDTLYDDAIGTFLDSDAE